MNRMGDEIRENMQATRDSQQAAGRTLTQVLHSHTLLIFILVFVTHVHTTNIPCLQTSSLYSTTAVDY